MKIVDCFIFYNELDLLNYRLGILNEYVDFFIIVESTHTFTGKEKNLIYDENKYRFEKYQDKIIHIIVNDLPFQYPNINFSKNEQWQNEYFQRNAISRGISELILSNNDIIIISDVDEIPNPTILSQIKQNELDIEIYSLEQDFYYYNLNTQIANKWYYSKILTYMYYINSKKTCNELRLEPYSYLKNGGWHLSYFGDEFFIQNKIQTFSHQELNTDVFTNIENIKNNIVSSSDLYNRNNDIIINKISIKENPNLPPNYLIYLNKYFTY
jgi:beta-1,4-mannosyl-glycoprotein beta-1,4-N-acetylglucosaminyltransferase